MYWILLLHLWRTWHLLRAWNRFFRTTTSEDNKFIIIFSPMPTPLPRLLRLSPFHFLCFNFGIWINSLHNSIVYLSVPCACMPCPVCVISLAAEDTERNGSGDDSWIESFFSSLDALNYISLPLHRRQLNPIRLRREWVFRVWFRRGQGQRRTCVYVNKVNIGHSLPTRRWLNDVRNVSAMLEWPNIIVHALRSREFRLFFCESD